jgi:carbohydrate kinase (thermoresistant glucokinase family)
VLVVMGVSGSGKTTIAALLAGRLHWHFEEGDTLHPPANIEKMRRGVPLDDDDRRPWLQAVARIIDGWLGAGERGVVACSALKRSYRQMIIGDRKAVQLIYLRGARELILQRMAARHGHFMPISLLDSQLETLEEPLPEEHALVISIEHAPAQIVREIETRLQLQSAE